MAPWKRALALSAALLCALPGGRARASSAPATSSSQSPNWGPDYKRKVQAIFDKLLKASDYDSREALARDRRDPTQLVYWEKDRLMEGSPLVALAAKTGPNPRNNAIVIVTYGALEIGGEDHLAFMMAHEISHLLHEHPQKLARLQLDALDAWTQANAARVAGMSPEEEAALFERETQAELGEKNKPFEREADQGGIVLMAKADYDPGKAGDALNNASDWLAALKLPAADPAHDPLAARVAALRTQAAQLQNARGRMADVMSGGPD
jgi:Zn-dependent protease with chaperone function